MRTISKTIHKEIWASSLPEDTRRRLGFLHSGLNTRSESNLRDIERNLRQIDQIRTFAVFTLGKYCRTGQPAGISSHDLHNGCLLQLG